MEWLTDILTQLSGLPWWAAFVISVFSIAITKGVDSLLRVWKAKLEERQYEDAHEDKEKDALVEELKARIAKLEQITEKQSEQIEVTRAAHVECQIESERLRGRLSVAEEKIARLEAHDRANKENVEKLKAAVIDEVPKTA